MEQNPGRPLKELFKTGCGGISAQTQWDAEIGR